MKNVILLAISVITLSVNAQEIKTWRPGVSFGVNSNNSKFSGGMPDANARFYQNPFGTGALDFIARYDYNEHWMASFCFGLTSTGSEFALAENYSFINKSKRFSVIKSDFGKFEIPAMLFYKFDPNCKNARWLLGAGFVPTLVEKKTIENTFEKTNEGTVNSNKLTSSSVSNGGAYVMFRWSVGREKIFKNGSVLNLAFVVNAGYREMIKTNVKYTVDNQNYNHNFTSSGNFAGLRLSYFLKPIASNKIK